MRRTVFAVVVTAAVAALLALLAIYGTRTYGLALFLGVPFVIGYATTALLAFRKAETMTYCLIASCLATLAVATMFIAAKFEGILCLVVFAPIAFPAVGFGAVVAWQLFHAHRLRAATTTTILLVVTVAAAIAIEPEVRRAAPPVYEVADSIEVEGTPQEVWQTVLTLGDIDRPDDFVFRSGITCPQTTRIVKAGTGGLRICTMTTGTVIERIDRWEPGRTLGWRALSTPPPMQELNPFGRVDAPHLDGFYRNVRGEFAIEPLSPSRTRLTRRTWYEHDLYPSAYWRIWCDIGASKIHGLVLEHVRDEVERRRGGRRT